MSSVYIDVETAPIANAAEFLEEPSAPANYKDADKIAAFKAEALTKAVDRAALDFGLLRIVALSMGAWDGSEMEITTRLAPTEQDEADVLAWGWARVAQAFAGGGIIIGYNASDFDVPAMITRSWLLGVMPTFDTIRRYSDPHVVDLLTMTSFGSPDRRKKLGWWAKRNGWPHDDTITGAQIPALVAAGEWEAVTRHVEDDVRTTMRLHQLITRGRVGWREEVPGGALL